MTKQTEQVNTKAIDLLKSLQGTKSITVPLVVKGQVIHEGIAFEVSIFEYNNFLNASQSNKTTMTAAASTFLKQTVIDEHELLLSEALKVAGMLDFFMGEVVPQIAPEIGSTLD